jgi:pentatricopeptide repeat protein
MLQADLIAYSASISACARGGHWQQALQLMAEMNSIELLPNIVSSLDETMPGIVHGK